MNVRVLWRAMVLYSAYARVSECGDQPQLQQCRVSQGGVRPQVLPGLQNCEHKFAQHSSLQAHSQGMRDGGGTKRLCRSTRTTTVVGTSAAITGPVSSPFSTPHGVL